MQASISGRYIDLWSDSPLLLEQMGPVVTALSLNGSWEACTGTIECGKLRIFGLIGILREFQIEWSNGAVWRRLDLETGPAVESWSAKQGENEYWQLPADCPSGWRPQEILLSAPRSRFCFAALLHGDRPEYVVYACVLGQQLKRFSSTHERVLLCGPGDLCVKEATRKSLQDAGWERLLPVIYISAPYLDKSKSKRHAFVFTKLHAFGLPYEKVLLLDVDLLPRDDVDLGELFHVSAPAGKYHNSFNAVRPPEHGHLIEGELVDAQWWCPNAGVLRLDMLPKRSERERYLKQLVEKLAEWLHPTYLPEQYFLAHHLCKWHHIEEKWNYEVGFEMDVPLLARTREEALKESKQRGQGNHDGQYAQGVRVWHYSGTVDTKPWLFLDLEIEAVILFARKWFAHRDPSGVLARAVYEWRQALMFLLDNVPSSKSSALHQAVDLLASQTDLRRRVRFEDSVWSALLCDFCGEERCHVDWLPHGLWTALDKPSAQKACAECVVLRLHAHGVGNRELPYSNEDK